ncbi:MAG: RHS repeat protein, partial [Desulfamplus sp.]|nr:RHS repeat protein [Desulfamplus sp.]
MSLSFGRVVNDQGEISGTTYSIGYMYDDNGVITGMTYPSGRKVTYQTDTLGRVIRVTAEVNNQVQTLAENMEYLPFGPATGFDYGSGTTLQYAFDQRYRLTGINDGSFRNLGYSYDPAGNITAITDINDPAGSQAFAYDNLYRLTHAAGVYGSASYTYDRTGNRLTSTEKGQAGSYTYEPGTNRLVQITGANPRTFSYDANGNTTSSDGMIFTWDHSNRLVSTASENGSSQNPSLISEYVYNAFGQRVIKISGGSTTHFVYDQSGNLIAEA